MGHGVLVAYSEGYGGDLVSCTIYNMRIWGFCFVLLSLNL